ncbi:MAG: nucleotidyltransferase domain-containing protein [Deltaproteobacteria bacterium]|nr:nucleotidyltransferase domain-containing protein [Deltaproteobacteria bacterium]
MESALGETVRRIVRSVHPKKILLFGSAARGEMGPNSDLDLLVIVADGQHRRKTAQEIYRNLVGVGFASDVVVVTESDVAEYRENPGTVISSALREGRPIYDS